MPLDASSNDIEQELDTLFRSRVTCLLLVTHEEERVMNFLLASCKKAGRTCVSWDCAEGFIPLAGTSPTLDSTRDALSALQESENLPENSMLVLKDFHEFWRNAHVKRKLRNLSHDFRQRKISLVIVASTADVPDELKNEVVVVDVPLPDALELDRLLNQFSGQPGITVNLTSFGRQKLVRAALGLTLVQAQRVLAKAIVSNGHLDERDIDLVAEEKRQILRESEALEYFPVTETPDTVGGLDALKDWLRLRDRAFSREAEDYGLPAPKGIALFGIPGTGKSLVAKMIGGMWRIPLLRLDAGALFGSFVGESEERTRRALRLAETVSPCILWIDEIEKAFAMKGGVDGGTSMRVFGSLLTWMQEKTKPVFVVATANDLVGLPPELMRRGRFDEIFFLDLPTTSEREEIFAVHLQKRSYVAEDFDLRAMAAASEGYVGAEIEQAIIDAMYAGFNEDRPFTTDDVVAALKRQVPISISQREQVSVLRKWLSEGRAQSATKIDANEQPVGLDA